MLRIEYYIITMTIALLLGCSSAVSPHAIMEQLNHKWSGHNVDEFFQSYGRPVGNAQPNDDGQIYRWDSIEPNEAPGVRRFYSYRSPDGKIGFSETVTNDAATTLNCEIRI